MREKKKEKRRQKVRRYGGAERARALVIAHFILEKMKREKESGQSVSGERGGGVRDDYDSFDDDRIDMR